MGSLKKDTFYVEAIAALIVVAAVFAAYWGTLSNGFVFDDNECVLNNPWLKSGSISQVLFSNAWNFSQSGESVSNYYRPLMYLIYMAEYRLFGFDPLGWHLVNVIVHAANGVAVYFGARLFLRWGKGFRDEERITGVILPSLAAALIFSLHTVNSEPVAWVAAITELAFTFFLLMALYAHARSQKALSLLTGLSLAAFLLSLLSKETAVALIPLVIAHDLFKPEGGLKALRKNIPRYALYSGVFLIYLALRISALKGFAPASSKYAYLSAFQTVLNAPYLFVTYLKNIVFPVDLSPYHMFNPVLSVTDTWAWLSILIAVIVTGALALMGLRERVYLFIFSVILVPLLPVFYLPGLQSTPVADRYLYLPTVGFALLLAVILSGISRHAGEGRARVLVWATVLPVVIAYGSGTVTKAAEWRDDITLWGAAYRGDADNYFASTALGIRYAEKGELEAAVPLLERAIATNKARKHPDYSRLGTATVYLADAYRKTGRTGDAIALYLGALERARNAETVKDILVNLGNAYLEKGEVSLAVEYYRKVLEIDPQNQYARKNLEVVSRRTGVGISP